jgi:tetratricopeptide (TPR) repeat protein
MYYRVLLMHDDLARALNLHQSGDLPAAARLYQSITARDPQQAEAYHLLGVVHHQQGQPAKAVELINRAISLRPSMASYHSNLAEAYRALGQLDRAVGSCKTALQLWPDFADAHNNLGLALSALGRNDEAVEHFHAAVKLRPDDAQTQSNLGNALRGLGKPEVALEHFRKAVELNPKLALVQTNLGQFLIDLGRAKEALPHCKEAVALDPNLAEAHNNLGNAYRALGELAEARACYLETIRLKPELTQAQSNLGVVLQQECRYDEALPWLLRACELEPQSHQFLENLAETYFEMERFPDALATYKKMLELEPERPLTYNAIGWLIQEEGRLAEARECYETALRLNPNFPPANISLGGLHEELGELEAAESRFRKALELSPGHTVALARLATLLRGKVSEAELALIRDRLSDSAVAGPAAATLLFALAHVLDERGDYDAAARALREANSLALANLERKHQKYSPAEHEKFVNNVFNIFQPEFFARVKGMGLETRRPVFIVGLPRSGTTLLEQVLASHSQVFGAGEQPLGRQDFELIPGQMNRVGDHPFACLADAQVGTTLRPIAQRHEDRLRELGKSAARVVDKMPDNYMYVGLLAVLFPSATFIHCRRDLRDVAVSCWMTNFRSIKWANDPEHIASRFDQYLRLMDHWRSVLPATIHEVAYEETVDDLERVARRLIAACGLEWEPACLDYHKTRRPVRTASVTQVRQPVYRKSVARWRNYSGLLADLFSALPHSGTLS